MSDLNIEIKPIKLLLLIIAFCIPAFLCGILTGQILARSSNTRKQTDEFISKSLHDSFSAMLDISKIDSHKIEELRLLKYRKIEGNLSVMKKIMADSSVSKRNRDISKGILSLEDFLRYYREGVEKENKAQK